MSRSSFNEPRVPSVSSHRLSSAASSPLPSRKSTSAVPTTSTSPPRTHISTPAPINVPWQSYHKDLVRRLSKDGRSPAHAIDPARASDPEKHTETPDASASRKRTNRPSQTDSSTSIRRASYTAAIFRQLEEETMPDAPPEAQQRALATAQGRPFPKDPVLLKDHMYCYV